MWPNPQRHTRSTPRQAAVPALTPRSRPRRPSTAAKPTTLVAGRRGRATKYVRDNGEDAGDVVGDDRLGAVATPADNTPSGDTCATPSRKGNNDQTFSGVPQGMGDRYQRQRPLCLRRGSSAVRSEPPRGYESRRRVCARRGRRPPPDDEVAERARFTGGDAARSAILLGTRMSDTLAGLPGM
jgi:hypothetical protein